jgi:putative ABC transport system permease protein
MTIRRQRRELGVLRALGFSRRQVRRSVAWLASVTMVVAVLIGVPLGMALGRWGWGRLAHNLGVPARPVVPLLALAVVVAVALVVAQLVALPVGWRAARVRAAEALHAE